MLRGSLDHAVDMSVRWFAEAKVLSFDDLYAGKLVAALDIIGKGPR